MADDRVLVITGASTGIGAATARAAAAERLQPRPRRALAGQARRAGRASWATTARSRCPPTSRVWEENER